MKTKKPIAILGAGIAGLTAAKFFKSAIMYHLFFMNPAKK